MNHLYSKEKNSTLPTKFCCPTGTMNLVRKLKSSCFDRGPWETGLPTGLLLNDNNFSRVTLNNVGRVSGKKIIH